ncbi:MAG: DUF4139 domain-containing protein [candidate division Zixibacteria bacterium HGW-Zixibacteria-1]|nr:MAG: DUF4139 domain-containing protein [candidate division Zixibacteria bacterium HGW-Zixibacteria-1]
MRRTALLFLLAGTLIWGTVVADEISVTVYNSNLGVVHETRTLNFEKGSGRVSFTDVPSQIDPTSVGFEMSDPGKSAVILEQNYAYDLVSPEKIYSKYIDKKIDLFDKSGNIFSGTLLSFSGGAFVLREDNSKVQIVRVEQVVNANFPELPEGLITRPTLFWLYDSDFSGKADCEVSYQTSGIDWNAEYVGILSGDEKNLDLTGWSSINNRSGATYKNATLKLIAGDIHRAPTPRMRAPMGMADEAVMLKSSAAGFEEKEFFEYHMYTLPRKATIADNEIKQIALFEPASTTIKKEYYYQPAFNAKKVKVVIKFTNSKEAGLGIPLPAGRTRVFKADDDGSMVLLGEDNIDHTPRDEEVKLTIGYAFDISAEETVLGYNRISPQIDEREYKIELRNHKKENVSIIIEKQLYGDWDVTQSSHEFKKKDANTLTFEVPVKADGKEVVKYMVRTSR